MTHLSASSFPYYTPSVTYAQRRVRTIGKLIQQTLCYLFCGRQDQIRNFGVDQGRYVCSRSQSAIKWLILGNASSEWVWIKKFYGRDLKSQCGTLGQNWYKRERDKYQYKRDPNWPCSVEWGSLCSLDREAHITKQKRRQYKSLSTKNSNLTLFEEHFLFCWN